MAQETVKIAAAAASTKARMLARSPGQYLVQAMLAGIYVGFGIILIFSIGAPLAAAGSPAVKAVMGASFAVALALVIFAGSELFTGNNMVMTIGSLSGTASWWQTLKIWIASYIGNLAGSLLLAGAIVASGLAGKAPTREFILSTAAAKMAAPAGELFMRGVLCNVLVCLAVWMALRAKDESAKLSLIFWCLFAFIGAGFEHSVANMTLLGTALLLPHDPAKLSWLGFAHNLGPVSLGNVVGGAIFVGAAYYYVARGQARLVAASAADVVPIDVAARAAGSE
jgi:nitrite transporter